MQIDTGYPTDKSYFIEKNPRIHTFDRFGYFKRFGVDVFTTPENIQITNRLARVKYNALDGRLEKFEVGDRIVISEWLDRGVAVLLENSFGTRLENITLFSSPGAGIYEAGGGNSYLNYQITRGKVPSGANTPRLLSINADGLHSTSTSVGPTVSDCLTEFSGDDAINIGTELSRIENIQGTTLTIQSDHAAFPEQRWRANDRFRVYDPTMRLRLETTVVSVESGKVTLSSTNGIRIGDYMLSPDHAGADAVVKNCVFRDLEARGIVMRSARQRIENNVVERTTQGGIWVGPEAGYFYEGDIAENIIIRGNTLRDVMIGNRSRDWGQWLLGAITVISGSRADQRNQFLGSRPNKNIVIENNSIETAPILGLFISNVSGARVVNNRFYRTNNVSPLFSGGVFGFAPSSAVAVHDSDHIQFDGNIAQNIGVFGNQALFIHPSADLTSINTNGITLR